MSRSIYSDSDSDRDEMEARRLSVPDYDSLSHLFLTPEDFMPAEHSVNPDLRDPDSPPTFGKIPLAINPEAMERKGKDPACVILESGILEDEISHGKLSKMGLGWDKVCTLAEDVTKYAEDSELIRVEADKAVLVDGLRSIAEKFKMFEASVESLLRKVAERKYEEMKAKRKLPERLQDKYSSKRHCYK